MYIFMLIPDVFFSRLFRYLKKHENVKRVKTSEGRLQVALKREMGIWQGGDYRKP